jgi:hypothetical protein
VCDVSFFLSPIPLSVSPCRSPGQAAQRQTSHLPGFQWCFSLPSTCLATIATSQHCCAAVSSDISAYKSSRLLKISDHCGSNSVQRSILKIPDQSPETQLPMTFYIPVCDIVLPALDMASTTRILTPRDWHHNAVKGDRGCKLILDDPICQALVYGR